MSKRSIKQESGWAVMEMTLAAACCASALSGCSLMGYYKYEEAERAPAQEAEKVLFPGSFEGGIHMEGPMMAAMAVAMNDFFQPAGVVKTHDANKRVAECLNRKETYDTSILKANDNLYFVRFIPFVSRCGTAERILDGDVVYAIDGQGRILSIR